MNTTPKNSKSKTDIYKDAYGRPAIKCTDWSDEKIINMPCVNETDGDKESTAVRWYNTIYSPPEGEEKTRNDYIQEYFGAGADPTPAKRNEDIGYNNFLIDQLLTMRPLHPAIEFALDWRTELYAQGLLAEQAGIEAGYYFTELMNEWPRIYNVVSNSFYAEYIDMDVPYEENISHTCTKKDKQGGATEIHYPHGAEPLDYFLDLIDTSSPIGKYSVNNIGRRTQTLVDDSINCIFEPPVPEVVYVTPPVIGMWPFLNDLSAALNESLIVMVGQYGRNISSQTQLVQEDYPYISFEDKDQVIYNWPMMSYTYTLQPDNTYILTPIGQSDDAANWLGSLDTPSNNIYYVFMNNVWQGETEELNEIDLYISYRECTHWFAGLINEWLDEHPQSHDRVFMSRCKEIFTNYTKTYDKMLYSLKECDRGQQHYTIIPPDQAQLLGMRNVPNGADVAMKDMLYQYTNYKENITLTTIPIYHLEPNTLIKAKDYETGINDTYLIKSISISFGVGQSMTISAAKALTKI